MKIVFDSLEVIQKLLDWDIEQQKMHSFKNQLKISNSFKLLEVLSRHFNP
jgi:hypothetical protein